MSKAVDLPARRRPRADQVRTEQFLDTYADVEKALKRKLKRQGNDRTGIARLIEEYTATNPSWEADARQLQRLGEVRNVLAHERSSSDGYPVVVTSHSLDKLRGLLARLDHPEPVSKRFAKAVESVPLDASLRHVLQLVYAREFSQFPVLDAGRFRGLLTENGITRWLGRYAAARTEPVDLEVVRVRQVLGEEDTESGRRGNIFRFVSQDTAVDEVMGLFSRHPMLEAVLITPRGGNKEPPVGIVTEWDACRHVR